VWGPMCFHGMGMWGRRLNFFVVVVAGEGTSGGDKDDRYWREKRKRRLTERIEVSVCFALDLIWN
jgi:hypothetical protein